MSHQNPKIAITDSVADTIVKMAEGNPGAAQVLIQIFKRGQDIDPQSAIPGLGPILGMDNLDIYGSKIWVLYSDICKKNLPDTLAVLRAVQLGILRETTVRHAIVSDDASAISITEIRDQVKAELPLFNFDIE